MKPAPSHLNFCTDLIGWKLSCRGCHRGTGAPCSQWKAKRKEEGHSQLKSCRASWQPLITVRFGGCFQFYSNGVDSLRVMHQSSPVPCPSVCPATLGKQAIATAIYPISSCFQFHVCQRPEAIFITTKYTQILKRYLGGCTI